MDLYSAQDGRIKGHTLRSRAFRIERGTKQGDPLSPALFNAVLEDVVRPLQTSWRRRGFGIRVRGTCLTNLRFADDIMLCATSRRQ
eukprot:6302638-Karenia_brevis.AAC.1